MQVETLYFNANCNCYLLSNNKECLLIDPGFNYEDCLIKEINKRHLILKGVLLTHGHFDHIEGLQTIKNVPVYVHKEDANCLSNSTYNCSFMDNNPFIIKDINIQLIEEGHLNLIGLDIMVIHTPFHTAGSVCYYLKKEKIIFTGDTLFAHAIGRSDLPTSQPQLIEKSLKKLFRLPHSENNDITVYPGHNRKTTLSREYYFFKNSYSV